MTAMRTVLIAMLDRVADGGDVTSHELDHAIPEPLSLDRRELAAWEELSHWADDWDIRAVDAKYAAVKRMRMRDHLVTLQDPDWLPRPLPARLRIAAGIWLAGLATVGASDLFDWGVFGGYEEKLVVALMAFAICAWPAFLVYLRRPS